jgi:predicted site-specific integrase-resolvase
MRENSDGPALASTREELLSPKQAAGRLGRHPQTVYGYLNDGTIRGRQFKKGGSWGIPMSEIDRLNRLKGDDDDYDDD